MTQAFEPPAGELTKEQVTVTKGVAILMMLFLHLFCRTDTAGFYSTLFSVGGTPLIYYFALFTEICVAVYAFCSGYGLFFSYQQHTDHSRRNGFRLLKLLCNYWIILLLTCLAGLLSHNEKIPGSAWEFFANLFLLKKSYCGAWWFLQTYVLLVLLSPLLFRMVKKLHPALILTGAVVLYAAAYLQKYRGLFAADAFGDWVGIPVTMLTNFCECLFPFLMGALCLKYQIFSRISAWTSAHLRHRNLWCLGGIALLILIHAVIQSAVINPFLAVPFLILFNLMSRSRPVSVVLRYFAAHSTNLWLTHMLFYMVFLPKLVFSSHVPVLIYLWLLALCLAASYLIGLLYHPLARAIDRLAARKPAPRPEKGRRTE